MADSTNQGLFDIGELKDGETVVISGAAGSVGLVGETHSSWVGNG